MTLDADSRHLCKYLKYFSSPVKRAHARCADFFVTILHKTVTRTSSAEALRSAFKFPAIMRR